MSGGAFDYQQYRFDDVASQIEEEIAKSEESPEIIERFKEAALTCRKAAIMAQRVDWLISGDDGPESFMKRWDEELSQLDDPTRKDPERLDKLEAYIKESEGIISFMPDASDSSFVICEEIRYCDEFPGRGTDLRSAIDSLKKD